MTKQEFLAGVPFTVRGCMKGEVFQYIPEKLGEAGWIRRVDLGGHHYCNVEFVTKAFAKCYKWFFMNCSWLVLEFEYCDAIPAPRIDTVPVLDIAGQNV